MGRLHRFFLWGTLLATVLLVSIPERPAMAGTLDSFERSVRSGPTSSSGGSCGTDSTDHCIGDLLFDVFGDFWFVCLGEGGKASLDRLPSSSGAPDLCERRLGEPLIPFVAIEPAWQMLNSDIEAWDLQAELGYGPVALQGRFTQFREDNPNDRMNISRALFLYRMSVGNALEIDLGVGGVFIDGNSDFGRLALSTSLRLHPGGPVGIEFRPAWTDNLADYDVSLYLTVMGFSLKGGYRWLNSPDESLNGPYVGLSLRL